MCGLTGFWQPAGVQADAARDLVLRMAQRIQHRGPDDDGAWVDGAAGIALGHRRLAIVDLSAAGHQPMASAGGRFVLAFNGEIYNHQLLRAELQQASSVAAHWRGHSDTETLLAGIETWGLQATLQRCVGMFAMALWDRQTQTLTLARDRIGEKPLYYGWQGQGPAAVFLFGSEPSALRAHPAFVAEIDRDALALYMRHNCIGGAQSIYRGVHKLQPGFTLTMSRGNAQPLLQPYWQLSDAVANGLARPFAGSAEEAVDALDVLLRDAVRQQMMADVPLGAFLSGGIDSSTVVALMQAQSSRPVKTFSIGFHEAGFNEAEHAKAVASHLHTDHTELYVTAAQAMAVIPRLPTLYAEPFADSSQIPTFLVSELARQHVTVSLSGDAGDELFAGYTRYEMTARFWHRLQRLPMPARRLGAHAITALSPANWSRLGALVGKPRLGDKLHKGAQVLGMRTVEDLYRRMISHWDPPSAVVVGTDSPGIRHNEAFAPGLGQVETMMAMDMLGYLPDDILVKVDRAAMGVSLETRVPMLDHRVVEFAWTLPLSYKLRHDSTKWPLRQLLYRHVPRTLIERPKMGFGVPIGAWLRGPLRPWAEDLLSEARLLREGYFHPAPIRKKWDEHLSGRFDWQYHLWDVLMFQAWLAHHSNA